MASIFCTRSSNSFWLFLGGFLFFSPRNIFRSSYKKGVCSKIEVRCFCRILNFNFLLYISLQVSWIRQMDLHVLSINSITFTSDPRFTVSWIINWLQNEAKMKVWNSSTQILDIFYSGERLHSGRVCNLGPAHKRRYSGWWGHVSVST